MKKTPSKEEVIIKAIAECDAALRRAYRHPTVYNEDLQTILGVVFELRLRRGEGLRLTRNGQ